MDRRTFISAKGCGSLATWKARTSWSSTFPQRGNLSGFQP
jgi:hypothetical protein